MSLFLLFLPLFNHKRFECQAVTFDAKADDDATGCWADKGVMTELLALVHVADVNLDDRSAHSLDGIVDGHAGMGVSSSIENDAIDTREV